MKFGKFVGELNKGIEGRIVAYDRLDDHCVLHLNDGCLITVTSAVIERQRDEALSELRVMIRAANFEAREILVTLNAGDLVIEPACEAVA